MSAGLTAFAVHEAAASGDTELAEQWIRAYSIGSALTVPAFFHLVLLYPRPVKGRWTAPLMVAVYLDAFLIMALAPTRFAFEAFTFDPTGHPIPHYGAVWLALQAPFAILLVASTLWLAWLGWRNPQKAEERDARGLLMAAGIPAVAYAVAIAFGFPLAASDNFDFNGFLYFYFVVAGAWVLATGRLQPPAPSTLGALLQSVREGVIIVDGGGNVVQVNPAVCRLLGRGQGELVGLPVTEFAKICVSQPERAATFATAVRGVQRGRIDSHEQTIEGFAGTRTLVVDIRPLGPRNTKGESPAVLLVWSDETERLAFADLLRRTNELQDLVIRVLGHDLKAPLGVVQGYVDLSRERLGRSSTKADLTKVRKDLGKISEAVAGMLVLMANARALSRLNSAAQTTPTLEDADIAKMVNEAVKLFTPAASTRELRIEAEVEDGMRARVIPGFESVPKNLIDNAVKYTPAGGQVDVRLERRDGAVRLTVEDTGPGVPPEKRAMLFRKFERLGAEKGAIEGQGLGLSITAKLVELSGGRISVGNRADGRPGAQFVVEIPQGIVSAPVAATSLSPAGS